MKNGLWNGCWLQDMNLDQVGCDILSLRLKAIWLRKVRSKTATVDNRLDRIAFEPPHHRGCHLGEPFELIIEAVKLGYRNNQLLNLLILYPCK